MEPTWRGLPEAPQAFPFPFSATPTGSRSGRPVEIEYGEAGFALLFPKMDGVKIQTFRFIKDPKSKAIDEDQFAEAGK